MSKNSGWEKNNAKDSTKTRRFFGLQSIESRIEQLIKPIFQSSKKEFIIINNLIKNWPEIIGKKYADFCRPLSVNFDKNNHKSAKLTIAVFNSAVGFFLENNSEIILERIATFYGFKTINKIVIKQEPKNIHANHKEPAKIKPEQEKKLQENLSEISDANLAETLAKIGREIIAENSKKSQ